MSLPALIEIQPLQRQVRADVAVPGSKSITNRALILAALAEGEVVLHGALWSEDTQIMVDCLQELGFLVDAKPDPEEFCNRNITVYGKGGVVPPGGTPEQPLELFVGNAGTAARFLSAFVCLGKGVYRIHGTPRMHERPQASLFKALRELGYSVEAENGNDKLPARIVGGGPRRAGCEVGIGESSQFASALLLCATRGGWDVRVTGENAEESPYAKMTGRLIKAFPDRGGNFQIEPDASSGSYFWAAGWLQAGLQDGGDWAAQHAGGGVLAIRVKHWPVSGWQVDADFPDFLPLPDRISREGQLGDSIMMAIVLAADGDAGQRTDPEGGIEARPCVQFLDLGRLRVQESERVAGLKAELTRCGARVVEKGDVLTVFPVKLHGAEIETYDDHRMAMCFAVLGLKVSGIRIRNPECVKKTFPNFFQKLSAPPPAGPGATILDAVSGRRLSGDELFAG